MKTGAIGVYMGGNTHSSKRFSAYSRVGVKISTRIALQESMTSGTEARANDRLHESVEMAARMLEFADRGTGGCEDDGCLLVYGIMRDCAYRIRAGAEDELRRHLAEGTSLNHNAMLLAGAARKKGGGS